MGAEATLALQIISLIVFIVVVLTAVIKTGMEM
jgi:hypothetical protein